WSGPRARAVDVVGLGQISLDRVAALPRWPRPGEKLALATPAVVRPGGQIATAVLAAVRLGLSGRLLGAVGDDGDGGLALARLRRPGSGGARAGRGLPDRFRIVLRRLLETGSDFRRGRARLSRRARAWPCADGSAHARRARRTRAPFRRVARAPGVLRRSGRH